MNNKPYFQFWFADEPHLATYEPRGKIAARLKTYKARKDLFTVRRAGLHNYIIRVNGSRVVACIGI